MTTIEQGRKLSEVIGSKKEVSLNGKVNHGSAIDSSHVIEAKRTESDPNAYPEIVIESDKAHFGKIIYSPTARSYYENLLATIIDHSSQEEDSHIEIIRRPKGLSVANFETDAALAEKLPKNECVVAFGHGSIAVKPIDAEIGGRAGRFWDFLSSSRRTLESGGRLAYYDPAETRSRGWIRGISGKAVERLKRMDSIDIKIEGTDEYSYEKRAVEVLKHIGNVVDRKMFSGVNITYSSDTLHKLLQSHMQCGAQGGSMLSSLKEFIEYANKTESHERKNLIPAIEMAEGLVITLDVELFKEGKIGLKIYDGENFERQLKVHGLTIGAEVHCVDDRIPYTSSHKHALSHRIGDYNPERKTHDPCVERERAEGRLTGTHHTAVIALCDSDNPRDNAFSDFVSREIQMLCSACVQGYCPHSIKDWKTKPTENEALSNTSGAMVFNISRDEMISTLDRLPGIYFTVGPGGGREFGAMAWEGSHPYAVAAVSGVVVGEGKLKDSTLVRTPAQNEYVGGPVVMATRSVIETAGGIESFLQKIQADKVFYAAIAVIDPETKEYKLLTQIRENPNEPPIVDTTFNPDKLYISRETQNLGGIVHFGISPGIHPVDEKFNAQQGALMIAEGKVDFISSNPAN